MHVWRMRMLVAQGRLAMRMGVRLAHRVVRSMGMLVMIIMDMEMRMVLTRRCQIVGESMPDVLVGATLVD